MHQLRHRTFTLSLVVLLAGCSPKPGDPGESATEAASTGPTGTSAGATDPTTPTGTQGSTGPESGSSGDPSSTGKLDPTAGSTTAGSTTTDSTTGSSTDGPDEPPDTTGGEVCVAPGPQDAQIEWALEVPDGVTSFVGECKAGVVEEQGPAVKVSFVCSIDGLPKGVVLTYAATPAEPMLWPTESKVLLDYRVEQEPWTKEWLAITSGESLLFGAIRADSLGPPGVTASDFFRRSISLLAPCDPDADRCGMRQGLALGFLVMIDGMGVATVTAGQHTSLGFPVVEHIWVEHASRLLDPIGCADVPPRWIDALILVDSSGA